MGICCEDSKSQNQGAVVLKKKKDKTLQDTRYMQYENLVRTYIPWIHKFATMGVINTQIYTILQGKTIQTYYKTVL
jgi:hypothetical protein